MDIKKKEEKKERNNQNKRNRDKTNKKRDATKHCALQLWACSKNKTI